MDSESTMEWVQYLDEIKSRLVNTLLFISICFFLFMSCADDIYMILAQPLMDLFPSSSQMIATSIVTPILTPIKLSFYLALLTGFPFALWQIWSFVAPALYENEKKVTWLLLISSTILFYLGLLFAYYIVLPMIILVATHYGPDSMILLPEIYLLLNFTIQLLFLFGLVFELPMVIMILNQSGILPYETLKDNRRFTIVIAFVAAMLLTPPDIISQVMLALPIILLIELGILLCEFTQPKQVSSNT